MEPGAVKAKTRLCDIIDGYLDELGLHSLNTVLSNSSRFFKDGATIGRTGIFRSTMLPPRPPASEREQSP